MALVDTILEKIGLSDISPEQSLKHPEILKVMTGLYVQARTSFEEIRLFRDDEFFQDCLGLDFVPAAGKQHCQKNTPEFLEGIIESATRLA